MWDGVCIVEGKETGYGLPRTEVDQGNEKENLSSKSTLPWVGGWTRWLSEFLPNLNYSDWYIMIVYFILWWESGLLVPSKLHHGFSAWIPKKRGLWYYTACEHHFLSPTPFLLKLLAVFNWIWPKGTLQVSFGRKRQQGREFAQFVSSHGNVLLDASKSIGASSVTSALIPGKINLALGSC